MAKMRMDGCRAVLLLAALALAGLGPSCSSEVVGPEFTPVKVGAIYTYITDAPACDVLGFRMNISGLKFRRTISNEAFYTVFPTASTFASLRFDFAALRDDPTVMFISSMNVDTYDRAELTLQLPKIALYDPAQDPPVTVLDGVLSTANPSIPLSPAFAVSNTTLNVLLFDFDMAKSLQLDQAGQVTKDVIPVFSATPVPESSQNTYGTFDNLVGFVTQVSATPAGAFIGTFNLQLHSGTGQSIPISLTSGTSLSGVPGLSSLETGRIVEVLATVDKSGNFVADQVEVEDRAVVEENRVAYFGTVLPTPVKDANGDVTQFKLYLRATTPDRSVDIVLDSVLTVNVPSGTAFRISPRSENLTPLEFSPSSVTVGQELLVHGQYTLVEDQPTVVETSSIYLRPQTQIGGLSSLISVGADGKSGAFWLNGCSSLLQTTPIMVMTTNVDTAFINAFGLNELSPDATLHVRGFPFFVKDATVIRGTPVPAGTLVLFASQVRQVI